MRINTNVSAMNAQRNLGQTNAAVAKQIGRLSSGFRINKAADDAAGLGIANKLRADLRAMGQAARNAEQGTSLLQVAEGATQTVQNIVERMKELAAQSASDTVDAAGRTQINNEFGKLRDEISRIVDTTKFQGDHLLKSVSAVTASSHSSESLAVGSGTANTGGVTANGTYSGSADTVTVTYVDSSNGWTIDDGSGPQSITDGATVDGVTYALTVDDGVGAAVADGTTFTLDVTAGVEASGGARDFLVSSSEDYAGKDLVNLEALDLTTASLGIASSDLSSATGARTALSDLDTALTKLADTFGAIGAAQNRMEFATQNVNATIENFAAAESTIRDADMAKEMTELSRQQILQQAGTAMLAQANQAPQGVLQLLR